ncbi:type IV pilus biogenesis protein PilM [Thermodesulfatator indicus]
MAINLGKFSFGKKGILGIDLGSYSIKVAEVESGSPPVLRSYGQVKLPEGGLWSADEEKLSDLAQKISSLLKNLKVKHKKCVVSISSYTSILKRLSLELSNEDDLDEVIREEAEAHIPFDLEEVYFNYDILNSEANQIDCVIAAARKDLVDNIVDFLASLKLDPIALTIDIVALSNLFEFVYSPEKDFVLVDLGFSKTSVMLWKEGGLWFYRDLSIGVQQSSDNKSINEDRIVTYINETLTFFEGEYNISVKEIYLCGGGCLSKSLVKKIKDVTQKEVNFLSYLGKFDINKVSLKAENYINLTGKTAIGLAITEISK